MKMSDGCVVFDFFDVLLTIVIFAGAPIITTMHNTVTNAASNFDTIGHMKHLDHFKKEKLKYTSRSCVLTA